MEQNNKSVFETLSAINVSGKTEKRMGLHTCHGLMPGANCVRSIQRLHIRSTNETLNGVHVIILQMAAQLGSKSLLRLGI